MQWVNRPNAEFRGFCGRIANGTVRQGDAVTVQPSGRRTHVAAIVTAAGEHDCAVAGQSVTLTLADEVDVSRGDVLTCGAPPLVSDPDCGRVSSSPSSPPYRIRTEAGEIHTPRGKAVEKSHDPGVFRCAYATEFIVVSTSRA